VKLDTVKVDTEYTKFEGGLDLESPALSISPGALFTTLNYEAGTLGGYRRIDGYERYSGQPSPSAATYYKCDVTLTETVSVGDTITGVTSGATGLVIVARTGVLCITKITLTFQAENLTVGGTPVGSTALPVSIGEESGLLHATALNLAADAYRTDIAAPTGTGAIRGVGLLKGVAYCFRDDAAGTAGAIYKATTAGWVAITLYKQISFDTGVVQISDGASIVQDVSGATATVKRVVHESGTWGSTAAGRLILTTVVGDFDATHDIKIGAVVQATATSLATQISILPGGRYELIEYNFYGSTATKRMYGCDGVNKGFEFDGDVYVPLHTGMTTDTPQYVRAFKKQLFFSFKGSSQNSGIGTPYQWTAVSGSAEIALGDDITGYLELPGKTLGIFARNLSQQLEGTSVADYVLNTISDDVGCIPRTAQTIGYSYCLDDRGIINIYPSDVYGNFEQNTVSRLVQPLIDKIRKVVVASSTYKARNQYRLYGSDGSGVCMSILEKGFGFTQFEYPDNVACAYSGEDTTGKDVVFFGSDAGMVYQADKGSSFDGTEIEAFVMLPFNNSKSPSVQKTYRKATIEMSAESYASIKFTPDFSYSSTEIASHVENTVTVQGAGGYWDVTNWSEFFYDSLVISSPSIRIEGSGTNLAIVAYSKSSIDLGHKLDGAIIHYTSRRLVR
jgi:hypothetical protein